MNRSYFGTDGIRGPYGGPVINSRFFFRLGAAAGKWSGGRGRVVIGWDTRSSGGELARAVGSGFQAAGLSWEAAGVLPTPALARATREAGATLGAMVTASHNPSGDNGIKFFLSDGRKLSDGDESLIEGHLSTDEGGGRVAQPDPGNAGQDAQTGPWRPASPRFLEDYIAAASSVLPVQALRGWLVALDTANGATCGTSPAAFRRLGADLVSIGCGPDGRNINDGVGSEHPARLAEAVAASGARIGVAHDGDGDRCILCDEKGAILDGDEILTLLAVHALGRGRLAAGTLVVTVQSNLGVDAAVVAAGGRVVRTPVGDRYVVERMAAEGATLGGESSGHIVFSDISATGDGLVAALKVVEVMLATGKPLSELRRTLRKFPQATESILVRERRPLGDLKKLGAAIGGLERDLGSGGRVLVRYSGTEPKLRFLVEGATPEIVREGLARLKAALDMEGVR